MKKLSLPVFLASFVAVVVPANFGSVAPQAALAEKTGVLDLELNESGGKWELKNKNYVLTFPSKPQVTPQDTPSAAGVLKGAMAIQGIGNDANGFFVVPVPRGVPFDVKAGLNGARDGMLKKAGGKLVKESAMTIGGITGKLVHATATNSGIKFDVMIWVAFDEVNRGMIGVFTLRDASVKNDNGQGFLDGFSVISAEKGEDTLGFKDFKLLEQKGGSYLLKGGDLTAAFKTKPAFNTMSVDWPTGANTGATAIAAEKETAEGLFITYVPTEVTYDEQKGIDASRDKMFEAMKVKLVKDKASTLSGLKGRVAMGTGVIEGKTVSVRATFVYLKKRRMMVGALNMWATGDKSGEAAANAFLKQIKLRK